MEGFEIGRRRPLRRNTEEMKKTDSPAPVYMNPDEETDINALISYFTDASPQSKKKIKRSVPENPHKVLPIIEIDLHIHELIDSTAGMDNYAMLQYQIDAARKCLKMHSRRIGQKIIFIHGKGDGVLRKELRALLAKEYASYDVQDASFQKYGFGATQVTVRQS